MNPLEIDEWIKSTLGKVQAKNTVNILEPNKLSVESIADFKSLRLDLAEEGYDVCEPHFNLVMADWNPEENGVYFLYGVNNNKFIFSVGMGDSWEVKEVLKQFNVSETEQLVKALKDKKFEKGSIEVDRSYGENWLEYGFEEPVPIEPSTPIDPPEPREVVELPNLKQTKKPWWQFW